MSGEGGVPLGGVDGGLVDAAVGDVVADGGLDGGQGDLRASCALAREPVEKGGPKKLGLQVALPGEGSDELLELEGAEGGVVEGR